MDPKGVPSRMGNERLRRFRERLRGCFDRRADALFELTDAVLAAGLVSSRVHRRGWGSLYAALSKGRFDEESPKDLLAGILPRGGAGSPVYAVDISPWTSEASDAEASPGRGYLYHPSGHPAGQPIVAGWAYQLVGGLSFERDSWGAPVDACRVRPVEDANDVAGDQVLALNSRLGVQDSANREAPPFVFDAGYDPVRLQRNLGRCRIQILERLNSGRTFYSDPPTPERRPVGRPFVHGEKFDLKAPDSWHEPSAEHASEDTANTRSGSGRGGNSPSETARSV